MRLEEGRSRVRSVATDTTVLSWFVAVCDRRVEDGRILVTFPVGRVVESEQERSIS